MSIQELQPVLEGFASGKSWVVEITPEACLEFANIFDEDGNGVISQEEFSDFCKFVFVMAFLHDKRKSMTKSIA